MSGLWRPCALIGPASLALLALLLGSLAACRVTGTFACETADQCRRGPAGGACVAGSCAFADEACASGWRYAESADEDVAGRCLGGTPPADCAAWTARSVDPCSLPAPLGPLQLEGASYTYDTDTGALIGGAAVPPVSIVLVQADLSAVRVASVTGFTVGPGVSLRITGSLPLIVAAWEDIAIYGTLDASSGASGAFGAGANPAVCDDAGAGRGEDAAATGGSGGGGGGGFQGAGGRGGTADSQLRAGGAPGPAVASPAVVRGGCPGAQSGSAGISAVAPSTPATTAVGGAGGGAVQLTARGALLVGVGGGISVGGAGGGGAPIGSECGGGGGGAGGFIGLEAASIVVRGALAANGGGGGGAALRTVAGAPGMGGGAGLTAAAGGNAPQCGTGGAIGAAQATLAGGDVPSAQQMCGGGGGGGGAGFVKLRSLAIAVDPTAIVSPAAISESP